MARKAITQKDPYYVMEGYRMCGFLRYEDGKMEQAFEYFFARPVRGELPFRGNQAEFHVHLRGTSGSSHRKTGTFPA
ncbi:hypothetical protein NXW61_03245 [Bacteroides xylanisolvens]|nr:hypothetical protein [Bacteroides xylanisolvens]